MAGQEKIRLLIADDHKMFTEGLRALLAKEPDIEVVGEAENGRRAVELAAELLPDVITMDIAMPELNGLKATRQILEQHPKVKVIALSIHSDRRYVEGMLDAGASGYLLKECAYEELVRAIHTVMQGKTYLSPGLHEQSPEGTTLSAALSSLTPRQREVLGLLAQGKSMNEIAAQLGVSVKTVEAHRQHIGDKLGTRSLAELTKIAIREGLTSLEN